MHSISYIFSFIVTRPQIPSEYRALKRSKHNNLSSLTISQIDWDTVASEAGYNSAATAKVRFGQVKKALGWTVRTAGARSSPTKSPSKVEKKPAKPRARKTKAMMKKEEDAYQMALTQAAEDESNGDEQDDDNGAKKEGVNGYKHEDEAIKVEDVDEDGDDTLVEEEYASADDYA